MERIVLKVDTIPSEIEDFSLPHSCRHGENDEMIEVLVFASLTGFEESDAFFRGWNPLAPP